MKVNVDMDSELAKAEKLLRLSSRGAWGLLGSNTALVVLLAWIFSNWENTPAGMQKFLQLVIVLLAFSCLIGVFYIYHLFFRRVDRVVSPQLKEEEAKNETLGAEKTDDKAIDA